MAFVLCDTYYEDTPTVDDVKREISSIVGLRDIKNQLEAIVKKIINAEKDAIDGLTVVPPKPFHMVFIGNKGTGKSRVARVLGKLFYLAGALPSYTVTEIEGRPMIKDVEGGVLVINVEEEYPIKSKTLETIIAAMDEGETSIIFAGTHEALNQCMKLNYDLYKRVSLKLQFDDLTCEELATVLHIKANDENMNDLTSGFKLDPSCCIENIAQIIGKFTPENLRSLCNAHLLDQMLIEAVKVADRREEKTISLRDFRIGVENATQIYKKLVNM